MGKILVIKGADFSAVAVGYVPSVRPTPTITFSRTGETTIVCNRAINIYYTIDGSTPTKASTKYVGPFNVAEGVTVKAIAELSNGYISSVSEKTYSVLSIKSYTRTQLDLLEGGTGYTASGKIIAQAAFEYRMIPVSGYSKITLSGTFPKYILSYFKADTITTDNYISEKQISMDTTLTNAEYSIPSSAMYVGINLFTDSSKRDQVVTLS